MKRIKHQNIVEWLDIEMTYYKRKMTNRLYNQAFEHLMRIHFVVQPYPIEHTQVHWQMWMFALRVGHFKEAAIQSIFLVLSFPATFFTVMAKPNGGSAEEVFSGRRPIPEDIKKLISQATSSEY